MKIKANEGFGKLFEDAIEHGKGWGEAVKDTFGAGASAVGEAAAGHPGVAMAGMIAGATLLEGGAGYALGRIGGTAGAVIGAGSGAMTGSPVFAIASVLGGAKHNKVKQDKLK